MDAPIIRIDMDKRCADCGASGITESGLCLKCVARHVTKGIRMNDTGIKLEALSVAMGELEDAWTRKQQATEDYGTLIKSTAEAARLDPSVIRAYVTARMADRTEKEKRKAEQLSLCFDQLGV